MSTDLVAQIVVGVFATLSAVAPLLRNRQARKTLRDELRHDIDSLKLVPDGEIRQRLERHVLATLDQIEDERARRREPFGIALAIGLIAVTGACGIAAINAGGPWLWSLPVVAFFLLVGAAGLAQDVSKQKRDEKGRPVRV